GLHITWAQTSRDRSGAVGLLALTRVDAINRGAEPMSSQAQMSWLAQHSHAAMARLLVPKLAPEAMVTLTHREKEILRWTAEGKTSCEVAQILSISERTVNFHINNAMLKLCCTNKTQASAKAAALGLFW